jgi:hypothetical protein
LTDSNLARPSAGAAPEAPADLLTRSAAWAMSLWLAAMAGWYVWTAVNAVRHPLNGGADRRWALLWLTYAGAALLWHVLLRRPLAAAVWSAGLAAVGLTMIVLSGQTLAALACLWLVVLAGLLGSRMLRLMRATPSDVPLEWSSVAFPAGLALLALAALALGLAGLLSPAGVLALCAGLTALEARRLWQAARRLPGLAASIELSTERSVLAALCGFVALWNLAWALAPEIQFDALNYHLPVPRAYLEAHRVVDLPYYWHSYFAQLVDSLFAICLAAGGQITAKLVTFSMGIVAALAVFALGRSLFNARVGLWAAALFYATPMTAWLSGTTYTDLALAFFLITSLVALLRWRQKREDGWLWASGFLAGGALGVKATALYALPVLGLVILWDLARRRDRPWPARLRSLAGFAAALSLSALPWYLLRYAFTGNPFFPLFNGLFHGPRAVPRGFGAGDIVGHGYGRETPFLALLKVPFLLTFGTNRFGEPFPAGALGLALVVLLPLGLLLLRRRRGDVAVALAACAVYLVFWGRVSRGVRHYFAILPLVVTLAVATVDALSPSVWRRRLHFALLGAVLLAQVAEIPPQFWNIPDRIPVLRVFGRETPEHFLSRALPAYEATQYINRTAKPGKKVLGHYVENLRFYLKPRVDTIIETWDLQREIERARGEKLATDLTAMGYDTLLLFEPWPSSHAMYPFLERTFLDRFATLEFSRRGGQVYRLGPGRPPGEPAKDLLANPGFETVDESGRPAQWTPHGREAPVIARGPGQVHQGDAALLLSEEGAIEQSVAVEAARLYTLGQFARAEGSHPVAILRLDWFDARGERLESSRQTIRIPPEWSWRQMSITSPQGAVRAAVIVSAHGDCRLWLDDMFFGPGAPVRP